MRIACYCASCQSAGRVFVRELGAPPVVADDGGTDLVLYRKDRVSQISGGRLSEFRLSPESPTRRMIATCCDTPIVMDFMKGHWLSFYRARLSEGSFALEMRVMTKDKPSTTTLPNDVPLHPARSARLIWKLVSAWVAMGLRTPRLPW